MQASGESLAQEKSALLDAKEASELQIRELEEDIKALTQKAVERETELERFHIVFLFFAVLLLFFIFLCHYFCLLLLIKSVCAG